MTTRNLCVLFADISGSSRLYERLGDTEALRAVERCLHRMDRATASQRGRVVKTIGDEIMATFDEADAAIHAAIDMQQRIDSLPPASGVKLAVRIGLHWGPTLEENEDVFGDTVNTASRLAGLAKGGQILTSAETLAALPAHQHFFTREIDRLAVKGKAESIRTVEVLWQDNTDLTMKSGGLLPEAPADARLRLVYGGRELLLDAAKSLVTLGRDPHCDIVVRDGRASRNHGRIERRRDKFVLVDQSTNGTYVTIHGEAEVAVKREEMPLRGRGRIAFGHGLGGSDASEVLEFEVL